MTKYIPPGFDAARITTGLHQAMGFGEATRAGDKATFYKITSDTPDPGEAYDLEGVPFNPDINQGLTPAAIVVPCAIEYFDRAEQTETFGVIQPSRIRLTLLDVDYQKIKGFSYVAAGGDKYYYASTEPTIALGSIDVWILHCTAQDEG